MFMLTILIRFSPFPASLKRPNTDFVCVCLCLNHHSIPGTSPKQKNTHYVIKRFVWICYLCPGRETGNSRKNKNRIPMKKVRYKWAIRSVLYLPLCKKKNPVTLKSCTVTFDSNSSTTQCCSFIGKLLNWGCIYWTTLTTTLIWAIQSIDVIKGNTFKTLYGGW